MLRPQGLLGFAIVAVALGMADRAWAQKSSWQFGGALGIVPQPSRSDVSVLGLSPTFDVAYRFRSGLRLGGTWGFGWVNLESTAAGSRNGFAPSNLMLSARQSFSRSSVTLELGGRAGIPLAFYWGGSIPSNRLADLNYSTSASARGWRDPFTWAQNAVPLVVDGAARWSIVDWLEGRVGVSPAFIFALNNRPSRFAVVTSVDAYVIVKPARFRLGWSYLLNTHGLENNDLDQHSVATGVEIQTSSANSFALDLHLNLDGPYGVLTGEPKPNWGLLLGWRFAP